MKPNFGKFNMSIVHQPVNVSFCTLLLILISAVSYAQAPVVRILEPTRSPAGVTIEIKGAELGGITDVRFGAVQGNIISVSDQLVEVQVPTGTTYERVSVTNASNGLLGYSNFPFTLSYGGTTGIAVSDFATQEDFDILDGGASSDLFDLCLCDIDGDGLSDIAAANKGVNNATLFRNTSIPGTITFDRTEYGIGRTIHVTCEDLNGDGKPELIFSQLGGSLSGAGSSLIILENGSTVGSPQFSVITIDIPENSNRRAIVNDIDLDGKPEIIVTNDKSNNLTILKNLSSGGSINFDPTVITLEVTGAQILSGLVVEDLNGDRLADIAVNQNNLSDNASIFIAQNNSTPGTISFGDFSRIQIGGTSIANLKVGDVNGDGSPDLVASMFLESSIAVLANESSPGGQISFANAVFTITDSRPTGLDFADLDGDGKEDLLVGTNDRTRTPSINILNNLGTSSISLNTISFTVNYINENIKSGDLDGDGKPDIAFTSIDNTDIGQGSKISILRNQKCIIPEIQEEGPITICDGNPLQLTAQLSAGATYEWVKDMDIVPVKSSADNFLDITEDGSYTVTLSDGGSCSETSSAVVVDVVTAGAIGTPTIDPVDPLCIGGTLVLQASDVGATQYGWRGPNNYEASGNPVTVTDNFEFTNSGRYYLDVYSGTCIAETLSVLVESINAPEFSVARSTPNELCESESLTLTISPNSTDYTYQWFNDSGAISGETGISLTVSTEGAYYAEIADQVNLTCDVITTITHDISFFESPTANFGSPQSVCIGSEVTFTNQSTVDSNADVSYLWTFGDGTNSSVENPRHIYNGQGDFVVTLSVTYDGVTCSDSHNQTLIISPDIEVEIESETTSICPGESLELSVSGNFNNYSWSNGETSENITVEEAGIYTVSVSDQYNCEGTGDIEIGVFNRPNITIETERPTVAPGEPFQLSATGGTTYQWTPEEVLDDAESATPTAIIDVNTTFYLEGRDANNCLDTASIDIFVNDGLIGDIIDPRNFFSPNDGDDINATWVIERIEQFPQCSVMIYDQAGAEIYEAQPYLNDWNGTKNGSKVPSGVYYYVIKCNESEITASGSVTLLR